MMCDFMINVVIMFHEHAQVFSNKT